MIEIEVFQRELSCRVHTVKIWTKGKLAYANEICKLSEVVQLRNALHNELLWLNDHIRSLGIE